MAYDPGAIDAALAAAVGDDPALIAELREALSVREGVPIVDIDARNALEVRQALAAVTEYAISQLEGHQFEGAARG